MGSHCRKYRFGMWRARNCRREMVDGHDNSILQECMKTHFFCVCLRLWQRGMTTYVVPSLSAHMRPSSIHRYTYSHFHFFPDTFLLRKKHKNGGRFFFPPSAFRNFACIVVSLNTAFYQSNKETNETYWKDCRTTQKHARKPCGILLYFKGLCSCFFFRFFSCFVFLSIFRFLLHLSDSFTPNTLSRFFGREVLVMHNRNSEIECHVWMPSFNKNKRN